MLYDVAHQPHTPSTVVVPVQCRFNRAGFPLYCLRTLLTLMGKTSSDGVRSAGISLYSPHTGTIAAPIP